MDQITVIASVLLAGWAVRWLRIRLRCRADERRWRALLLLRRE